MELTSQTADKTVSGSCQGNQNQSVEMSKDKDREFAKVTQELKKALEILRKTEKESAKLDKALQECEGIKFVFWCKLFP